MTTRYLAFIAMAWVGTGLVVAFVMRRRGHDFYVWLALGTVLGPLVVPLAIERARFHGAVESESAAIPTPPHRGFDILAGVDGSDESIDAIRSALDLFGDAVTSVTIATVLDYDSESAAAGAEPREKAEAMLRDVASGLDRNFVSSEILYGRADRALAEYARTHGAELIVVGARGHGASETLFGSITSRLVGARELPVYVGPGTIGHHDGLGSAVASGAGT